MLVLFLLPFRAQLRRRLPYGSLKVLQPPPRKAAGPPARITSAMAALAMALQTATVKGSRAAPDCAGDSNIMAQLLMMMLLLLLQRLRVTLLVSIIVAIVYASRDPTRPCG